MSKWKELKFEYISTLNYGKGLRDYTSDPDDQNIYRVYGANGQIGWCSKYIFNGPGIIIGRKGALGGVRYCENPYYVIDTAYSLDIKKEYADIKYAYYFLLTIDLNRLDTGSAIPSTRREDFYNIKIPLPPLETQKKIASILSAYDDLIENNRRRIILLEESARLLYKEWFVKFKFPGHEKVKIKNGIPEGWERKKIEEVAEKINYGYTESASIDEIGPKFLRITDIVPYILDWSNVPYCRIEDDKKDQYLLKEGDIVIARTGATTGYAKRIGKKHPESVFASYLIRVRLKKDIDDIIGGLFIESEDYKSQIKANLGGAAQPNANAKTLTNVNIIVPSKGIQKNFRENIEPIFLQKETLTLQNQKLKEARDILLPKLMNGKIEV